MATKNYQYIFDCLKNKAGASITAIAARLSRGEEELKKSLDLLVKAGYVTNQRGAYMISTKGFLQFNWKEIDLEAEEKAEKKKKKKRKRGSEIIV